MGATLEASIARTPKTGLSVTGAELRLDSISKSWGARRVLDDVSLELAPGVTSLAGANGAGKTTLLRIACGLLAPDSGAVAFDGLHPRRDRRRFQRRLGLLSAGDRGIYARLTVRAHLELWARLALVPEDDVASAQGAIVAMVGLEEILPLRADRLSMGQRQRLRLAMTFLHSPDLVLLDEPMTSLDAHGAAVLRRCIASVIARGGVVVWCSPGNDGDQAPFDRRFWLEGGKLREIA